MIERILQKELYSKEKLDEFILKINTFKYINDYNGLCIYTTGSFGRLEASEFSDIDLFFLYNEDNKFSNITKTLLDAHIINTSREMNFPDFSGDGEYLEIHQVKNIHSDMGSRNDDYHNYFTARMLLLLESKPIVNEKLHSEIIDTTINKYYKDFHEHEKNFQPVFIVNDVIRFWRTLCLNYEHSRNRKFSSDLSVIERERKKAEAHIKNLKLKFSRKLTCYSFLLSILCNNKKVLDSQDIKQIIGRTPLQRLKELTHDTAITENVNNLIELYFWFLDHTQIEKEELVNWIIQENNRNLAFENSRKFGRNIYQIMTQSKYQENLMYFLI